ncbi:putative ALA-interacting subunit 2 isoform X2 [Tasmannia lanceolata]|uniref:putative ALA-interacting subunit 2 isoform X2 n=1 Tax=Tasmannia lanceolata TaxID=3420 RepID=UPI004064A8EA
MMDMEVRSTSGAGGGTPPVPVNLRRSKAYYRFTQQNLPACKPVLTPGWVISIFLLTGVIFMPIGLIALHASQSVVEIVYRYDTECIPESFRSNKVAYIKDSSISKNCNQTLKVQKHMKAPIHIYYQLDNYYQNHRRYVKSRSDRQLLHGLNYNATSSCQPEELNNELPIVPCGLIAWSMFNDTYTFSRETAELKVNRKNIAWKSDREHKFGKDVYPFNFQNGTLVGGGKLNPRVPLNEQEDLIVWMRTAALPSFRKLYGRIEVDLEADEFIAVKFVNNYNSYSFGGEKKLVLSTSSWLGGKNDFLGVAYIAVGCCCIFISLLFTLLHVKNPRHESESSPQDSEIQMTTR